MKDIIAVIPARAGSKGIPNKNIRIINGRPMVWYAIKNAKNSEYITKVIVSTDSEEVALIAKQMGVFVHIRDERLCNDEVTLDEVIYDAIKDEEYDYVVTMQPTSPTLKVSTLDNAIKYAVEEEKDTLISVINAPHLSWKEVDGKKIPNYVERLNRQYLPVNYLETGAFVISDKKIVKETSRIGGEIDVFEISEEEAVDVDNFADLMIVEKLLCKKKIAIYVNGNNRRGIGHIYRALEIADEFYTKPDIFFDINQTEKEVFGKTTHNLIPVNGLVELFDIIKKEQYDIFINDILATTVDYMASLRQVLPNCRIINFEDDGEGAAKADVVINALYSESSLPNAKVGEKYYISSKLFMFYDYIEIKDKVENVLVTFGGADPMNYSERLLKIISKEKYNNIYFNVILGRAKENIDELMSYAKDNISILIDVKNMPEIMSQSDIAITSRGRTGYELACLGVPTIAMAQNEREERHRFVDRENGFCYLGINPCDYEIESTLDIYINMPKSERERLQSLMKKHDLRSGRNRVVNLIDNEK